MIAFWLRRWLGPILRAFAGLLSYTGVTPAVLSVGGLLAMVTAGMAFAENWTRLGGSLVLIGGVLDSIDGEVARASGLASNFGAFVDSVCDHLGDMAIYLGLGWRAMGNGDEKQVMVLLAVSFGSLFGSLIRARAALFQLDLKEVGFASRCERLLVVLIGSLGGHVRPALWTLALLTNISALQRLWFVLAAPAMRLKRLPHRWQKVCK
jgi:CDP-diacylglycerol---glycerol-3-phosphate 3-phosphatidyltransferase